MQILLKPEHIGVDTCDTGDSNGPYMIVYYLIGDWYMWFYTLLTSLTGTLTSATSLIIQLTR